VKSVFKTWDKTQLGWTTGPLGQALSMLDRSEKKKLGLVCITQTLLGFLDLIGVAIIGLVGTLAVKGIQSQTPTGNIARLLETLQLSNFTFQIQIAFLGLIAATILIARSLFSMFLSRRILYFLSYKAASMSSRLVKELLARNMTEIQRKTSQETLYAVTTGVSVLMLLVVAAASAVFADVFLLLIFSIGLFIFDPLMAASTLILFGFVSIILYFVTQKKASELGQYSSQVTISSNKKILEVINSFREIYVHDLQQNYAEHITQTRNELAEASAELTFIPNISKYVIEITLVAGGVAISAIQFLMNDAIQAVSTLAVFLAAASRIAPAILRLQSGTLAIKSSVGIAKSTLELIEALSPITDRVSVSQKLEIDHEGFKPSISIMEVGFSYSNSAEPTLRNVSLEISPGSQVAIVGSSGAGKSTLVDLILGLRGNDTGQIFIGGLIPGEAIKKWPGAISYVPQNVFVSDSTILTNVAFGYEEICMDLAWEALEIAQLSEFVKSLPLGVHTPVGEGGNMISGGERQRLGIARALYTKPKLLILDEATSSLDAQTEVAISEAISKLRGDVTIIMIAHRLSSVKNADQVVYLQNGNIVAKGSFSDVKSAVPDFEQQASLMGL
jgi:ABC-type multidrug transport system fused ATPase/permease subunit